MVGLFGCESPNRNPMLLQYCLKTLRLRRRIRVIRDMQNQKRGNALALLDMRHCRVIPMSRWVIPKLLPMAEFRLGLSMVEQLHPSW